MTKTKSKKRYLKEWNNYINGLWGLAYCKDEKIREAVKEHIEALQRLVPLVANKKDLK